MESNINETEKTYTLDIPQREGKDGFIGTHFTLILQLGNLIGRMDNQTDFRLLYMVNLLISLIPGKQDREALRKNLKDEIESRMKGITDNKEKGTITQEVCLEHVGNVMDFIDKHVGVSKENKIGFVVKK